MRDEKWVNGNRITILGDTGDGLIYCYVEYFAPGQSLQRAPVWERGVYVVNNENGRTLLGQYLDTFVQYVRMFVPFVQLKRGQKVVIDAKAAPRQQMPSLSAR